MFLGLSGRAALCYMVYSIKLVGDWFFETVFKESYYVDCLVVLTVNRFSGGVLSFDINH